MRECIIFKSVFLECSIDKVMFEYNEFPIIRKSFYNNKGTLFHKSFRCKSIQPWLQTENYHMINVIDIQNSEHLTLKQIFKKKNAMLAKQSILAEITNQTKMNGHENFITMRQVYEDQENIYLLMQENMKSLEQILEHRTHFLEREVQYVFCQLVSILESLRKNNIFHGNISLSTLHLHPNTMKIKLSGFDHSISMEKVKDSSHPNLLAGIEPSSYTSPELLQANVDSKSEYYMNDVWAVGVAIYALLLGTLPFVVEARGDKNERQGDEASRNKKEIPGAVSISKLKNYSYTFQQSSPTPQISTIWRELLKKIFQPINKRISLYKLLNHPLNDIAESQYSLLSPKDPPKIKNHFLQKIDKNLQEYGIVDDWNENTSYNPEYKCLYGCSWEASFCQKGKCQKDQIQELQSLEVTSLLAESIVKRQANSKIYSKNLSQQSQILLDGGQIHMSILAKILKQLHPKSNTSTALLKQPEYIERYYYIEKLNAIGYILNNSVGVVFADGSCVIGQNGEEYDYYNNRSIEDWEYRYCKLYDKFYLDDDVKKKGSYRKQQWEIESLQSKIDPSSNQDYISSHKKSKSNSNDLNQNSRTNSRNKKTTSNSNILLSRFQMPLKEPLKTDFVEEQNDSDDQCREILANYEELPPDKAAIYDYFIQYFGERVVYHELSLRMLRFWRIKSANIFLYNNGVWQVNFDLGFDRGCRETQEGQEGDSKTKMVQGAVLIDENNIGWWLPPCEPVPRNKPQSQSIYIKIARKLINMIKGSVEKSFLEAMQEYHYAQLS